MEESILINLLHNGEEYEATIRTCCEKDIYYYDVWRNDKYQFTVSKVVAGNGLGWKVSLRNADLQVDQHLVNLIGDQIELALQ